MKNVREFELVDNKAMRESVIDKVEVLDKVKHLLLLPNTEFATTEQVAEYYEVDEATVRQILVRNNDELMSDGVKVLIGKELSDIKSLSQIKSRARQMSVFPKRAILRVGMLLRDSEVAKEVRTRLLDIIHDTQEQAPEIVQNIVNELTEEQLIQLEIGQAMATGDIDALAIASTKLSQLKNKRIAELEPKAEYHDNVLRPSFLKTTTDIAKDLGMTARKLNSILHDREIIYPKKVNGKIKGWYLYAGYEHLVPEYADYQINEYGQLLKWTEKGRKYIIELLDK